MSRYTLNDEALGLAHTYTSYDNRTLKIRKVKHLLKDQVCEWCDKAIEAGSSATYYSGLNARKFYSYY